MGWLSRLLIKGRRVGFQESYSREVGVVIKSPIQGTVRWLSRVIFKGKWGS